VAEVEQVRLIFVIAVLMGTAVFGGEQGDLRIKAIPGPLRWKNSPTSSEARENALTIGAGPSTDWYISPVDGKASANAPVLLFQPTEEFVLTAKVTVEFQTKWDAGTLMVYINDSTWAKFALEMSVYQQPTIVTVVTRGVSDDCNSASVAGNSVWLRIAKIGPAIGFYASPDGGSWKMVRAFTFGPAPDMRAGFSSQSPAGKGGKATFSEITYSARKIKDIFTGE
jgi:regulation of enolase protein 1 (concanavalin A-like superfamily)